MGTCLADDQFEIVSPHNRDRMRGHFWLSDGPTEVFSANQSVGNRLRVGADFQFGSDCRWILGATLFDLITSGESSNIVGDISREGWDFDFGYFIIPDRLWVEYSFQLGSMSGSNIGGHVGTSGNALDVGYRFYNHNGVNLAVDVGYLHIQSESVETIDFSNQTLGRTFGTATYPGANIWTVALVFGFDTGGITS